MVLCVFTVPQSVSDPFRITWFKGRPQNQYNQRECSFLLKDLVQFESDGEYRLKLDWGEGNVYIFPQAVNVTVKELTEKPTISVPALREGKQAKISCTVPGFCPNPKANIVWTGIEPDQIDRSASGVIGREFSTLTFHPKFEHHNTNLTCRVIFQGNVQTESTVILKVRHAPIILNSSCCFVWGDDLSCVCVSSGVPLPQIHWLVDGVTECYSAVSAENAISIINFSVAGLGNLSSTVCVSENPIGKEIMKIQVQSQAEKPKVSWSFPTPWISFILSIVLNVVFASCLIAVLGRRERDKRKVDNRVYMAATKTEESVYETIKMSSERFL
ncbi:sialoadhesin-like [Puntigrus tetrazona]|uniref:sialoadhesin-like n=1 Tax=Puntigrus tetrazona TaxID=1606681 RepID=UPI001C89179D|nr:sialoadhesin-like [Puntigrus tetrazona]